MYFVLLIDLFTSPIIAFLFFRLPKFRKRLRPMIPCYQSNVDLETNTIPLTRHLTRINLEHLVRHESLKHMSNGKHKTKISPQNSPNLCINPINGIAKIERPMDRFEKQIIVVRRKFCAPKTICPSRQYERRFSL